MKILCLIMLFLQSTLLSKELPITIIVPSYNNKEWYNKNLDSLLAQNYSNYHILYTDDCSPDGTGALVEKYIKEQSASSKITLLKNKHRKFALENIYNMVHSCSDNTIIVVCDGDDWFAHNNVLSRINKEYQDPNIWMTYGSFIDLPSNRTPCKDIKKIVKQELTITKQLIDSKYPEFGPAFIPAHPKTFYAKIFKKIPTNYFLVEGNFSKSGYDGIGYAIQQLVSHHFAFIPDILYVHNSFNTLNDHKVDSTLQYNCSMALLNISNTTPLKPIKKLFS